MNQPSFDGSSDPGDENSAAGNAGPSRNDNPRRNYQCDVQPPDADQGNLRAFLGIHFKCCKTYGRIYRIHHRYVYEGRCPKCRGLLTVPIGPGGTDSRFLTAQ